MDMMRKPTTAWCLLLDDTWKTSAVTKSEKSTRGTLATRHTPLLQTSREKKGIAGTGLRQENAPRVPIVLLGMILLVVGHPLAVGPKQEPEVDPALRHREADVIRPGALLLRATERSRPEVKTANFERSQDRHPRSRRPIPQARRPPRRLQNPKRKGKRRALIGRKRDRVALETSASSNTSPGELLQRSRYPQFKRRHCPRTKNPAKIQIRILGSTS